MTHEQVAIQEMYKLNFTAEQIAATLQLPVKKFKKN